MDNLIFSLNATVPIFLMMLVGLFLNKIGWLDDGFASKLNTFVFRFALPVMLFGDLASVDFKSAWDTKFVLFCFFVTIVSIAFVFLLSKVWQDKSIRGEFIQASYRSSAAILGIAFIQNIYGNSGMGPLMIIGSVPLYNIMAVVVLSLFRPDSEGINRETLKKTLIGILKNPIIISIVIGLAWSLIGLPYGGILQKTVTKIGATATPLGLMAMGATFDIRKAFAKAKPSVTAAVIKLVGFAAIFLPIASRLSFSGPEMVALLVMLGSPTTVSTYVMAKNMGHEGTLSSSTVMLTTMLSAFTLTGWLYLLKCFGLV